jgi:hypothetical protein
MPHEAEENDWRILAITEATNVRRVDYRQRKPFRGYLLTHWPTQCLAMPAACGLESKKRLERKERSYGPTIDYSTQGTNGWSEGSAGYF